jgi:hypothetical protein
MSSIQRTDSKSVLTPAARQAAPDAPAANVAPVAVAPDQLSVKPSTLIALPGIQAGQTLKIDKGSFKGHGFGGKATVSAFDGKTLDMMVNAKAMIFIKVNVHMRFELQPDGSVLFVGERVGKKDKAEKDSAETANMPEKVGTKLTVRSQKPGETVFNTPDGGTVTLTATPNGGIGIDYDKYKITLKP